MIRDLALCAVLWGAFLAGIATTLFYIIKSQRIVVRQKPSKPPALPAIFRSELPTLTDLRVEKVVGELARKCRNGAPR